MAKIKQVKIDLSLKPEVQTLIKKQNRVIKMLLKHINNAQQHTSVIWPDRTDMDKIQEELSAGVRKAKKVLFTKKKGK